MGVRGFVAGTLAVALIAVASPAQSANDDRLTVEGTITILADAPGEPTLLVTDSGETLELEGSRTESLDPGDIVRATVVEPETSTDPHVVLSAVVLEEAPPAQTYAASYGKVRQLDVAVNINPNTRYTQPTNAQIEAYVQQVSDYWVQNTNGAFGGFNIRKIVRYNSTKTCNVATSYDFATEAASKMQPGRTHGYYVKPFTSGNVEHLLMFGECRNDAKAAVGTLGLGLDWGGWMLVQDDLVGTAAGRSAVPAVVAHEFGHNVGLEHANGVKLTGCSPSVGPFAEVTSCPQAPYEDRHSVMGIAIANAVIPKLDLYRRDWLGTLDTGEIAHVIGAANNTYALSPVGTPSGLKGVRISSSSGAVYYVEYRSTATDAGTEPAMTGELPVVRVTRVNTPTQERSQTTFSAIRISTHSSSFGAGVYAGEYFVSADKRVMIYVASTGTTAGVTVNTVATGTLPGITIPTPSLGAAVVGTALSATTGVPSPADAAYVFDWYVAGARVAGGTTYTPKASDVGKALKVTITALRPGYLPTQKTSANVTVGAANPSLSAAPAVGKTVTAVPSATVPAGAAISYEWSLNGTPIPGATAATYTPTLDDFGATLTVSVSATWAAGALSQVSLPATVQPGTLTSTLTPVITGTMSVGQTLTASAGATSPAAEGVTYQWRADGVAITGATAPTFVIPKKYFGSALTAVVTSTAYGYAPAAKSSAARVVTAGGAMLIASPKLSGTARVGTTLKPSTGEWVAGAKVSYQWLRNGVAISGATGKTYTPKATDRGKKVALRVTAKHSRLKTVVRTTSALTVGYGKLTAPAPRISGSAIPGQTLTAVRGTWTSGATFSYRWYANGVAIPGATSYKFKVTSKQIGKKVTFKVTGKKTGYTTLTKTAPSLGVLKTVTPKISGTAKVNSTLTASPGSWTTGTAFTYRWYANGVFITGATAKTFLVTEAELGKTIKVRVTGTKSGFTTVAKNSVATKAVVN